jgi:hypothetical protein
MLVVHRDCDLRGSDRLRAATVTATTAACKRAAVPGARAHPRALCPGQQPLLNSLQLEDSEGLRQRGRKSTAPLLLPEGRPGRLGALGGKTGDGPAAHRDHACSPQLCCVWLSSLTATVAAGGSYMPPRPGFIAPLGNTHTFFFFLFNGHHL